MDKRLDLKMVIGMLTLVSGFLLFGYGISFTIDFTDIEVYSGLSLTMFGSFLILTSSGKLKR